MDETTQAMQYGLQFLRQKYDGQALTLQSIIELHSWPAFDAERVWRVTVADTHYQAHSCIVYLHKQQLWIQQDWLTLGSTEAVRKLVQKERGSSWSIQCISPYELEEQPPDRHIDAWSVVVYQRVSVGVAMECDIVLFDGERYCLFPTSYLGSHILTAGICDATWYFTAPHWQTPRRQEALTALTTILEAANAAVAPPPSMEELLAEYHQKFDDR